ncbi:hypothetical protein AOLI_G00277200 [Acnodon oligacanthus]
MCLGIGGSASSCSNSSLSPNSTSMFALVRRRVEPDRSRTGDFLLDGQSDITPHTSDQLWLLKKGMNAVFSVWLNTERSPEKTKALQNISSFLRVQN